MPGIREIIKKIKSVESTQKITRAMEMVAASKMRKAQQRMQASRPYAARLRDVITHMTKGTLEFKHPYMEEKEVKCVGFIVVATDHGLCGGLNANLFKAVSKEMKELKQQGLKVEACTIGEKAKIFFASAKQKSIGTISHIGDSPKIEDIVGVLEIMLDAYEKDEIQKLYLVSNEFINTMSQKAKLEQLLPVTKESINNSLNGEGEFAAAAKAKVEGWKETNSRLWDYIYEPSAETLLPKVLSCYLESLFYQAVVENIACEQAARMIAMKSATENASDLIDDFKLLYNKARQATITKELSEIVSGAQAV